MYTGVPLKLPARSRPGSRSNAKWLMAEGADAAAMNRSVPIEKRSTTASSPIAMNGEALYPEQGYPVRLVLPGWQGNMWVKWLRRIKVGDEPWYTREETSKYTDLMADGQARQLHLGHGREVRDHQSERRRRRCMTRASPCISGLAWSGRGTIKSRRRLARWRPQLARRPHRRSGPR